MRFQDMEVWRLAFDVAIQIHRVSSVFPRSEDYGLTSQMRRSAVSVFSNIAEGFGRGSEKEKCRYYLIAKGSMMELESQLEYAYSVQYLDANIRSDLISKIQNWYFSMNKLLKAINNSLSR